MKRKIISILVALGLMVGLMAVPAQAADLEDIEAAIDKGLEWLAEQQMPDGAWRYYSYSSTRDIGVTGLVLLKFVERAKELGLDPFDTDEASPTYYQYSTNVTAGFDYLFNQAIMLPGDLVYFGGYTVYSTAIAMMPLAATNAPAKVIGTGALSGWTYQQALQGMMDWMVDAQNDGPGCDEGGWGYYANYTGWSDQSNSGYATLGLGYASAAPPNGFGLTIPAAVLTKLSTYIDNVQDPMDGSIDGYDGGSWYEPCSGYKWVNILKTGNMLYEMAMVGDDVSDTRVQNAIAYIEGHWNDTGGQPEFTHTSLGWKDSYQAMFTMMKGFEAFGIDTIEVGAVETDWFDEVADVILAKQNPDGSWEHINTSITEGDECANLRAAWAMMTLEKVVPTIETTVAVDIKPQSCPNPLNLDGKGVLPVAILGTEDFDVTQVDPASIVLTMEGLEVGVAPLRWSPEDVATPYTGEEDGCYACTEEGPDGYLDLTLKFKMQEVIETLGLDEFNDGDCVMLKLTGNLTEDFGSTPFSGEDVIRIIEKK